MFKLPVTLPFCAFPSECRICVQQSRNKHVGALHECYDGVNLGAADIVDQVSRTISASRTNCRESGSQDYTGRKLNFVDNEVVLPVAQGTKSGPGTSSNMTDFRFCEVQNRRQKCCSLVRKMM